MTVSSQTNKVIYIGNGVAKEFAIPFSFLEKEHIKVRQKKNDIQTERTDWTVKGGNLVFADAPENGAEIAIVREVPLTQETDYRDNEILHAETLERNFDKLTMQVQQLAEKSARAVTVDIFDDTAADSLIPSIRKAVSDCTAAAQTAVEKAAAATASAANAASSEVNTAAMLETKANADLGNLTAEGKSVVSNLSMPSGKYVDLTLQESGHFYTAPADGWFVLAKDAKYAGEWVCIKDMSNLGYNIVSSHAGYELSVALPARKGSSVAIGYSLQGKTNVFRFIYAQGENN